MLFWASLHRVLWDSMQFTSIYTKPSANHTAVEVQVPVQSASNLILQNSYRVHWLSNVLQLVMNQTRLLTTCGMAGINRSTPSVRFSNGTVMQVQLFDVGRITDATAVA